MFGKTGKMMAAGFVAATLFGGVSAAGAAGRPPKPAAPSAAGHPNRFEGLQGWLSILIEPIKVVFCEGPRIDPLGALLEGGARIDPNEIAQGGGSPDPR